MKNTPTPDTTYRPRVVAVDDEPVNLDVIEGGLAPLGYRIIRAGDADSAMELMLAERPDLVLLDVMMPGESGIALCRRMKRHRSLSAVPVILVTALDAASSRTLGLEAGADDYIEKPIDVDQLMARVRSLIARTRGADSRHHPSRPASPRRAVAARALASGLTAEEADRMGIAAALHEIAARCSGGEYAGALADAMSRAAGFPSPSSTPRQPAASAGPEGVHRTITGGDA